MAAPDPVSVPLSERLGLAERELVAIVGAGGKTTILQTLGRELAADGERVVLTTTTKMAASQVSQHVSQSAEPRHVDAALAVGSPVWVVFDGDARKVTGPTPEDVDRLYTSTSADFVIVEADGAAGKLIKAPADHEPVIPSATTTVVIVASLDAIGRPIAEVAHRPELVASITARSSGDTLSEGDLVRLVTDPHGGLNQVPAGARSCVVLTTMSSQHVDPSRRIEDHSGIERAFTWDLRTARK